MKQTLSDIEMLDRMQNGWRGGLPFTVCGISSLLPYTRNARQALPKWCLQYGITTVNDAGAGDWKWREDMPDWSVRYRAFDLVPRNSRTVKLDITTTLMPPCDLILCRMVLNHIRPRIEQTLELFRQSGGFLAATQFNKKDYTQNFARIDLRHWLGEPLDSVQDGKPEDCRLALWKL